MITFDLELGIDAIADILRSEFSAKLQAVYAQQRVQIPFRDLAAVYVDEVETIDAYPCCEIIAANSDFENENSNVFVHELSLQFSVNGDNPQLMAREVKRLVSAGRKLFSGTLQPYVAGRFRSARSDYGPTSAGRNESFIKSAALQVFWYTVGIELA